MNKKLPPDEQLLAEINDFLQQQQSLILSTADEHGKPLASYAPYLFEQGSFYCLLSELAQHTKQLKNLSEKKQTMSVMLIEDEQNSRNIFARKRLTYHCAIQIEARNSEQWLKFIPKLQQKFGNTIELLSQLEDFQLFSLIPQNGNYVRGFGQAFAIKNGQIEHLKNNR